MKAIIFVLLMLAVVNEIKSQKIAASKQSVKRNNGITYKSPIQYNDYIVGRQTTLMKNIIDFSNMAQNNPDSAEKMLDAYSAETATMINEIKGMPPYRGDSSLREAAIGIFSFYKRIFEDDYKQILQINKEGGGTTEEGADKLNKIVEKISKEEEVLDKTFHNAQSAFARKNNMKLIENEMQKKVDDLNKD